jgi:heptosyltransferase-2
VDCATTKTIRKILIIQTAFAGDVILTTPLIRAAQNGFPNAKVHFLAIPVAANILENNPHLTHIWLYDKRNADSGLRRFLSLSGKLRRQNFDIMLVPHRSIRSALLALLSAASIRIGFDTSAGAFLFTQRIKYRQDVHEIERNLSLIKSLGIQTEDRYPEVFPDHDDIAVVNKLLTQHTNGGSNLVAVAPGSVWPTKRWPKESYSQLCKQFSNQGTSVFLIGGSDDKILCDDISNKVGSKVFCVAGQLTLRQSAELLKRCSVLVTNDSAPLHMAAAVGIPTVAIFGPTIPGFGFYPYRSNSRVIEKVLSCRPCSIHGSKKCPINTHECMTEISASEVMKAAVELMAMR